jgi:hypothetical protein
LAALILAGGRRFSRLRQGRFATKRDPEQRANLRRKRRHGPAFAPEAPARSGERRYNVLILYMCAEFCRKSCQKVAFLCG